MFSIERAAALGWAAALVVLGLGCGEEATTEEAFSSTVVPLLEQRCAAAACHGSLPGSGHELDPERWLTFTIDKNGKIQDTEGALLSVKSRINSAENPAFSSILRKTLPLTQGGEFHYRGPVFSSREDPDYRALAEFVGSVSDGTEGADSPPLNPLEQRFADEVYPTLVQRGCMTATCHGTLNFGVSFFEPPAVAGTLLISREGMRRTYHEAKRSVTLWGDPLQSRLITKMLPLEYGGIAHKGGNDLFLAAEVEAGGDPRDSDLIQAMVGWIQAERAAAVDASKPSAQAIVYVGGPLSPAGPFQVQGFVPGTDLYVLDAPFDGEARNLTAAAHTAPADVRDPAINHAGTQVVFSMRTAADDAHNIYVIGLDGAGLQQLTFDSSAGGIGNFGPVFGPNGGLVRQDGHAASERIYYSSNRGDYSDDSRFPNADLYGMDPDGSNLEQFTFTVVPEVKPWFLNSGEFAGAMAYSLKRSAEGGYKGVFFRFPICHNAAYHIQPEAHPHFGMSEPQQVFYNLRERPDGRAVITLQDQNNVWRGGQLAMLERQFAVEIPVGQEDEATLPGFRHALTVLTPDAARTGPSADGLWRDPTPMPDGSIVVAWAEGPIDLSDANTAPVTRLQRITVTDDRATNRPQMVSLEPLGVDPGMAQSQPVAVYARAQEDEDHARKWTSEGPVGTLLHSGVQVIEAVLSQLSPISARTIRTDLTLVRAVAPLAIAGPLPVEAVPADETRDGHPHATNLAITGRMPLFAAVEVPVAADGSLAAHIPARVSVRVVTLNDEKIATGTLQHQWYAVQPGESFPVGIPESSFSARCAGCHGGMDGDPHSVLQPPTDLVTQASITLARYEDGDRRKPLELPTVDASMFILVDFQAHVQPILDAKCASCHSGDTPAGGLSLTSTPTTHYNDAYESLLAPGDGSAGGFKYVDALGYRARGSALAERLLGRELEASAPLTGTCPPEGSPALTVEERTTLLRWIELGAAWIGVPPSAE